MINNLIECNRKPDAFQFPASLLLALVLCKAFSYYCKDQIILTVSAMSINFAFMKA